ncbi:DUF6082 family protein [Actinomadura sp. WMMB 499]|uniref:DUF6082 family protein n=1 Tax=Actinomadura sp. WMMB 499 TaxID=1219491 RepID=UPI0012441D6E|nr:DUF6082 family protein [Actinomadura sp. WMMB 499]QFG20796.1 hypothetical protein F7P10_06180 [Actinomadura sp. WMMB 499]
MYMLVLALAFLLALSLATAFAITGTILDEDYLDQRDWRSVTMAVHLSIITLVGVGGFLILQARETKIAREEARRIAIAELLKMAMDDPGLDEAWGPVPEGEDRKTRRQLMYINMIVSEWQMSFETKALPEKRLRAISREMFSGRPGRAYWQDARQVRMSTSETRQARRFHQILDEEYDRAPVPQPESRPRVLRPWARIAGAATGAAALVPLLRALIRRTSRTPRR